MDFQVTSYPDEFTIVDKTDDWVVFAQQENEIIVELVAVGINDAAIAVAAAAAAEASANAAATSEGNAAGYAAQTAADAAQTGLDAAAATAAAAAAQAAALSASNNAAQTAADAATTIANAAQTAADAATTTANAAQTSADAVQTGLDAAAAAASAALAASVIPTGGNTGQVLAKASPADYDYMWITVSGLGDMTKAIYDPTAVLGDAFDRANHHGTQLAATISDFSTAADARVSAAINVTVQAYNANLTTWAGIAPSANAQSFVSAADYAAMRGLLSLVPGVNVQAYSANLTTWAGVAPSANGQSLVSAANYAAMRTLLNVEDGADVTDAANVGSSINGAAAKATPVDADTMPLIDSAAGNALKKVTWANVKATLKTYLDTLYQPLAARLTSWAAVVRVAAFDTFAATPTSANLLALLTTKTGTGNAVFGTSPTIATPAITDPVITGTITEDVFTITDAAAFVVNPRNGSIQRIVLGASRTPVPSGWVNGDSVTLLIDDGSAFAITWSGFPIVWKGGTAPTLATSGFTEVNITREGNVYRGVVVGDFAS